MNSRIRPYLCICQNTATFRASKLLNERSKADTNDDARTYGLGACDIETLNGLIFSSWKLGPMGSTHVKFRLSVLLPCAN